MILERLGLDFLKENFCENYISPRDDLREELITLCHSFHSDDLSDGKPHDMRAPDYDDWSLDGDLLIWDETLKKSVELSSMGIRVDEKSLKEQLEKNLTRRKMKKLYNNFENK